MYASRGGKVLWNEIASTNVEPRNCPHPDIPVLVEVVGEDSHKRDVILVDPSVADNNVNV